MSISEQHDFSSDSSAQLVDAVRRFTSDERVIVSLLYVVYQLSASKKFDMSFQDVPKFIGANFESCMLRNILVNTLDQNTFEKINNLVKYTRPQDAAEALFNYVPSLERGVMEPCSRQCVELLSRLLDVTADDDVCEYNCGCGNLTMELAKKNPKSCVCTDENERNVVITQLKANIGQLPLTTFCGDVLMTPPNISEKKFSKILVNFTDYSSYKYRYLELCPYFVPRGILNYRTALILQLFQALDQLDAHGKLIMVVPPAFLTGALNMDVRKYLLKRRLVEKIVQLPAGFYRGSALTFYILVLSFDNKSFQAIDASQMGRRSALRVNLSEEDLNAIVENKLEPKYTREVSFEDVNALDCRLDPGYYCARRDLLDLREHSALDSGIVEIKRGLLPKKDYETSNRECVVKPYLTVGNIVNGKIVGDLPEGTFAADKIERYLVENNSLVVSKAGWPLKTAVALVKNGLELVAGNNVYVIKLDPEKFDPYYVQAFLESEEGQEQLKYACGDGALRLLSVEAVRNLMIPNAPIDEQRRVGSAFKERLDKAQYLAELLRETVDGFRSFFSER